jgi:predicted nuclease of predicted toxin-antitoxin system
MRLIVDENMPGSVVRGLRDRGHDVLSVKESLRGQDDEGILARAQAEGRLVVTQDKDFGELAFRCGLPAGCGIILFRLAGRDPDQDVARMLAAIESRTDWAGHFAVVTEDLVRVRALPSSASPP